MITAENGYEISMRYDEKAQVWIATSDDVAGLVLESGSLDALIERVRFAVPELLELNGKTGDCTVSFFASRKNMRVG